MTNEELEKGFNNAKEQWNGANVQQVGDEYHLNRIARYFFWAGGQFGVSITKEIYSETIGKPELEACPECGGVNGHKTPFCSKVNLEEALRTEANQPR